jgi:VIT1/CCC1 family predicted Fe2+/Mn2+ transporter
MAPRSVLGVDDGIILTASLVMWVATAVSSSHNVVLAGIAGSEAGAMAMPAGEYVSVSSQADTQHASLAHKIRGLAADTTHGRVVCP